MNSWLTDSNANKFDDVLNLFDAAKAEAEQGPIAPGKHLARLVSGVLDKARSGNTCYRTTWEITEGEFAGRQITHRYWFTAKAIGRAKAELTALGIGGEHLRGAVPVPQVMAELSVVQRADEVGDLYAEVRKIRPAAPTAISGVNKTESLSASPAEGQATPVPALEPETSAGTEQEELFVDDEFGEF